MKETQSKTNGTIVHLGLQHKSQQYIIRNMIFTPTTPFHFHVFNLCNPKYLPLVRHRKKPASGNLHFRHRISDPNRMRRMKTPNQL
ncbi:hypothetical protein Hanom_Chr00s000001g01597691 [Helianthus anomalus]